MRSATVLWNIISKGGRVGNRLRQQLIDAYHADELATVVVLGERLLASNEADVHVLIRLGAAQSALAQYDIAQELLERALAMAPDSKRHIVVSHLGDLYKHRGDLQAAAEHYQEASRLDPTDATNHVYRGAVLARLGRLAEAEEAHREATRCAEGCIDEAYLNLGLVLRAQGKLNEAGVCFEKAIELDPEYEDAKLALQDVVQALEIAKRFESAQ